MVRVQINWVIRTVLSINFFNCIFFFPQKTCMLLLSLSLAFPFNIYQFWRLFWARLTIGQFYIKFYSRCNKLNQKPWTKENHTLVRYFFSFLCAACCQIYHFLGCIQCILLLFLYLPNYYYLYKLKQQPVAWDNWVPTELSCNMWKILTRIELINHTVWPQFNQLLIPTDYVHFPENKTLHNFPHLQGPIIVPSLNSQLFYSVFPVYPQTRVFIYLYPMFDNYVNMPFELCID